MRKSMIYIMAGLVLLTSGFLLPLDVALFETYRGYDIFYDIHETRMYVISGLSGQYSTVTLARAAIDAYLGPPPAVNQAPHAEAGGPYSGKVGDTISLYSVGSYDPDGDSLTYYWTLGDGHTSTTSSPQHIYTVKGIYTVKLTVKDPKGLEHQDTATVTIVAVSDPLPTPAANKAPTANAGGPYSGVAGVAVSFSAAKSSDIDGSIVGYEWLFGDGGSGSGGNPRHTYAEAGAYTVVLTVYDDDGATAKAQVIVSIVAPATTDPPIDGDPPGLSVTQLGVYGLGAGLVLAGVLIRRAEKED